jgi:hypothetical protein
LKRFEKIWKKIEKFGKKIEKFGKRIETIVEKRADCEQIMIGNRNSNEATDPDIETDLVGPIL